jgi:Tol biopolymer transport system component
MRRSLWQRILAASVLGLAGLAATVRRAAPAAAAPVFNSATVLTTGPVQSSFSMSPDGLWTVYATGDGLYSVPTGGGRARLIDEFARFGALTPLTISPDSSRIVYTDESGVASQAIAGSAEVRLLASATPPLGLEASPDGHVLIRTGPSSAANLFSVPIEGGPSAKLNASLNSTASVTEFVVSPDGSRVVFVTSKVGAPKGVYVVPTEGGAATKINGPIDEGEVVGPIRFTTSGSTIVYESARFGSSGHDLYSVTADGQRHRFVSSVDGFSINGRWTVGKDRVFVVVGSPGGEDLVAAPADLSTSTLLYSAVPFAGSLGEPLYVPETERVLIDNRFATADLMSALADGSGAVTLFSDHGTGSFAVTSDGQHVVADVPNLSSRAIVKQDIRKRNIVIPIANFGAKIERVAASGKFVVLNRNNSPWVADLDGSGATEVAPVSGTVDNATFHSTPDGRRIVVMQDRVSNGSYGLYEFDRGYADGKHATFVPLTPTRILDTRPSEQRGYTGGKPAADAVVRLPVRGVAGIPNNGDVKAVVLNVTAVDATAAGYVTVWPSDVPMPLASNLNLDAVGQTRPNLVTVEPGSDGSISLYTSSGAHLIADVAGYYTFAANARAGRMFPLPPTRLLDTRVRVSAPEAGSTVKLAVKGQGGVPSQGVAAVVLTITATSTAAAGFVTVWPSGLSRPLASNLNIAAAGQTIANQVIVPLGADGSVSLFTDNGTHLIADVAGWFTNGDELTGNSGLFLPVHSRRPLDTRSNRNWVGPKPAPGAVATPPLDLVGDGVSAYVANVTLIDSSDAGFVTAFPGDQPRPNASNLNSTSADQTIANHVTVVGSSDMSFSLYTSGGGHLVGDINGVYRS